MLMYVYLCGAEVISTAFFDVELDALEYSVEDDGRVKLSERPYLKVCPQFSVPHEPKALISTLPQKMLSESAL